MIIYGSRVVHIKSVNPKSIVCPSCGSVGATLLGTYRSHIHIFWIPLLPLNRIGVAHCANCKTEIRKRNMTDEMKKEYQYLKSESRGPIWQFSGVFLILLIALFVNINAYLTKQKEAEYINNPSVGDIYELNMGYKRYSTAKVIEVKKDSLCIVYNIYETNMSSGISDINTEENYSNDIYVISLNDLQYLYSEETIYRIIR